MGRPSANLPLSKLGHTTGDTHDQLGPNLLQESKFPQKRKGFVFRLFPNATSVQKHHMGFVKTLGGPKSNPL
jgi:hypothetical protein